MASARHVMPGEHIHEDMILCDCFPLKNVISASNMELKEEDVIVASYPKTGTTLIQEVVWLIMNNVDVETSKKKLNMERIPFIEYGMTGAVPDVSTLPRPLLLRTHVPYRYLPKTARTLKCKVVYIVRNPKDTLVSYYHFYRMNKAFGNFKGSWDDFFTYFMDNGAKLGYGNPLDHMKGYWEHRNDENLLIVSYEDLLKDRTGSIRQIARFLGKKLGEADIQKIAEITSFEAMKANPMTNYLSVDTFVSTISPFIRKGKVGDWKDYFNQEQNEIIARMHDEKLGGTGLEFTYELDI